MVTKQCFIQVLQIGLRRVHKYLDCILWNNLIYLFILIKFFHVCIHGTRLTKHDCTGARKERNHRSPRGHREVIGWNWKGKLGRLSNTVFYWLKTGEPLNCAPSYIYSSKCICQNNAWENSRKASEFQTHVSEMPWKYRVLSKGHQSQWKDCYCMQRALDPRLPKGNHEGVISGSL